MAVRRTNAEGEPTTVDIAFPGAPTVRIESRARMSAQITDTATAHDIGRYATRADKNRQRR